MCEEEEAYVAIVLVFTCVDGIKRKRKKRFWMKE
jgi:hypothetical protein